MKQKIPLLLTLMAVFLSCKSKKTDLTNNPGLANSGLSAKDSDQQSMDGEQLSLVFDGTALPDLSATTFTFDTVYQQLQSATATYQQSPEYLRSSKYDSTSADEEQQIAYISDVIKAADSSLFSSMILKGQFAKLDQQLGHPEALFAAAKDAADMGLSASAQSALTVNLDTGVGMPQIPEPSPAVEKTTEKTEKEAINPWIAGAVGVSFTLIGGAVLAYEIHTVYTNRNKPDGVKTRDKFFQLMFTKVPAIAKCAMLLGVGGILLYDVATKGDEGDLTRKLATDGLYVLALAMFLKTGALTAELIKNYKVDGNKIENWKELHLIDSTLGGGAKWREHVLETRKQKSELSKHSSAQPISINTEEGAHLTKDEVDKITHGRDTWIPIKDGKSSFLGHNIETVNGIRAKTGFNALIAGALGAGAIFASQNMELTDMPDATVPPSDDAALTITAGGRYMMAVAMFHQACSLLSNRKALNYSL